MHRSSSSFGEIALEKSSAIHSTFALITQQHISERDIFLAIFETLLQPVLFVAEMLNAQVCTHENCKAQVQITVPFIQGHCNKKEHHWILNFGSLAAVVFSISCKSQKKVTVTDGKGGGGTKGRNSPEPCRNNS